MKQKKQTKPTPPPSLMRRIDKMVDFKTFPASVLPVLYGAAYVFYRTGKWHLMHTLLLLFGVMCVQAATNMINDYFDYKRQADTKHRAAEKTLVSGEVSLKAFKRIIMLLLTVALGIGLYFSVVIHPWVLVVMTIAVTVLTLYSAGPLPLCYTPFGEVVSGLTMGLGITAPVMVILSGQVNESTFMIPVPTILYIGTILLTNNLSDIRGDLVAGRKTLPILIGEDRAKRLWIVNVMMMLIVSCLLAAEGFYSWVIPLVLGITFPWKTLVKFMGMAHSEKTKGPAMGSIAAIGIRYHGVAILLLIALRLLQSFGISLF